MPGIVALVTLFSLDVTNALVNAGYVASTFTVTGASNTTPIVVTTAVPHNILISANVVISGVTGNTNANSYWIATTVDATHLALSIMNSDGTISPSVGDAPYVSGGLLQTAFTDGQILRGRQHAQELSAPPRVVFVPVGSTFSKYPTQKMGGARPGGDFSKQRLARMLWEDRVEFEVNAWGSANPAMPDQDFDVTQAIYQQITRSAFYLSAGDAQLSTGVWVDQRPDETQLDKVGHLFQFRLSLSTPITDYSLQYVPPNTGSNVTINILVPPNDTPEEAWSGNVPGADP